MLVLIVEDDPVSRKALARLLRANGYDTQSVESGEQALKLIHGGWTPNVVLIDVDLPGMDGLELIARLARERPQMRTILTTAVDREGVQSRLNESSGYLRKPLQINHLMNAVAAAADCGYSYTSP